MSYSQVFIEFSETHDHYKPIKLQPFIYDDEKIRYDFNYEQAQPEIWPHLVNAEKSHTYKAALKVLTDLESDMKKHSFNPKPLLLWATKHIEINSDDGPGKCLSSFAGLKIYLRNYSGSESKLS